MIWNRRKCLAWTLMLSWYLLVGTLLFAEQLPVNENWKFQFDLANAGTQNGWGSRDFDASSWQTVVAGKSWTEFGYFGYNGVAWYRKEVQIPQRFRGQFIVFWGIKESCTVYMDGAEVAHCGAAADPRLRGRYSAAPPFRLRLPRSSSVTISVRVAGTDNHAVDTEGPGLVEGVALSDETLVAYRGYWLAPDQYITRDKWLNAMRDERARRRAQLGSDRHIYTGEYAWTSRNFLEDFVYVYDTRFYDRQSDRYLVSEYLADGQRRFGGYDSLLLWHAYPNIGVDSENQFEMLRSLPGGLPGLRSVVDIAHSRGVRTYIAYNPWDRETAQDGVPHEESLAEIVKTLNADGVFLDVTDNVPQDKLRSAVDRVRRGVSLEPEGGLRDDGIATLNASWGQDLPSAGYADHLRGVPISKWTEPRHMIHYDGDRWRHDRSVMFQHAFLNGAGVLVWDDVFGTWNGYSERDQAILRRMLPIERQFSELLASEEWEPFYPTLFPEVDASYWPGRSRCLWTIVNWGAKARSGSLLRVPHVLGDRYFDLWNGTEIQSDVKGSFAILNTSPIEPYGFAAILSIRGYPSATLLKLLRSQRAQAVRKLSEYSDAWPEPALPKLTLSEKTVPAVASAPPENMVLIPSTGDFLMSIEHNLGEGSCYPDDERPGWFRHFQFMYEEGTHYRNVLHQIHVPRIPPFVIDKYLVTNAEYKIFLDRSGYHPADPGNFLKNWDWSTRDPKPPTGLENHPVTWVDLDDARAYAAWAGKRLPSEAEWQYAAGGVGHWHYPWGNAFLPGSANDKGTSTTAVDAFPEGRSPLGLYDMSGNVWQWTESERDDGNRYALLRGGSFYQVRGAKWYFDRYIDMGLPMGEWSARPTNYHVKLFLMSPSTDRKATIGFRCVKDVIE
jgi:gamma-glutamyl hercynylcysteine S-oxide synthase